MYLRKSTSNNRVIRARYTPVIFLHHSTSNNRVIRVRYNQGMYLINVTLHQIMELLE